MVYNTLEEGFINKEDTDKNIGYKICSIALFIVFTIAWVSISMYNLFHHTSEILISIITGIGVITTPTSVYNIFISDRCGYLIIQIIIICITVVAINDKQLICVPIDMCVMFIFTSVIAVFTLCRSLFVSSLIVINN